MNDKPPIKIVDNIPFFSLDRYWGKSPKEVLEKALVLITERGWDEFEKQFEDKFDFTFEENRADWRFLVPMSRETTVLDVGAGMGRISIPLARVAKEVVAVDPSFLRMKFLKLRAEKENLQNLRVCVGDIFDLPFERESFDLIVMNGVLEWLGVTDRYRGPEEAQVAGLKVCRGLLKPGGYLYIGIENRIALAYLRAVDHSGLCFTSYLPRWLANIYTLLRKNKRYRTYTYTKGGYERLLRRCGFTEATFYIAYPGYNLPRIMIPYDDIATLAYAVRTFWHQTGYRGKIVRWLSCWAPLLYLYRYFCFSFGIVIKK